MLKGLKTTNHLYYMREAVQNIRFMDSLTHARYRVDEPQPLNLSVSFLMQVAPQSGKLQ